MYVAIATFTVYFEKYIYKIRSKDYISNLDIPAFWKGLTIVMMDSLGNSAPSTNYGISLSIIYCLFSHEDG